MADKTKIDWADATWNPVTGCLHGCEYCYAKGIANRYGGNMAEEELVMPADFSSESMNMPIKTELKKIHVIDKPIFVQRERDGASVKSPYPFNFDPTFHRYRLDIPKHWTKPRNIFVCSMADLFGAWVPDEWIREVFDACWEARHHRYLFLTKNSMRFKQLHGKEIDPPPGSWIGTSITKNADENGENRLRFLSDNWSSKAKWFVSVEPLLERLDDFILDRIMFVDWVIIGAESGNRKGRVFPEKSWIDEIVQTCDANRIPVFMKESIRTLMGDDFRQEYPWEAET